jgi:Nucleotidyltransferase domain
LDYNSLPSHLIEIITAELSDEEIAGIVLGGSYARGDANSFSDVDFAPFLRQGAPPRKKQLGYRHGYLVSISYKTVAGVLSDIKLPNRAIWVVNGFKGARVLLDRDGSITALLREIEAFAWEPLQQAANDYAGASLAGSTEAVHKLLGDLSIGDDLALSLTTANLLSNLTDLVAVQRGVMLKSDRAYYRQVQESVGPTSAWTRYHNIAAGVTQGSLDPQGSPSRSRALAVLALYKETVKLVGPFMAAGHRETAAQAVSILSESGNEG